MLSTKIWIILAALFLGQLSLARTITIMNSCGTKIFPAYAGSTGRPMQNSAPAPAGWEIPAGGKTVLDLPDTWLDGRIWVRSGGEGCATDVTKCLIGRCQSSGGLECDGTELGGLGRTLAEFGMQPGQDDFYDVSMVEAFTVAMKITPSDPSCAVGSCGVDADPLKHCDARLAWPKGTDQIWGCASPCMAGVQFTSLMSAAFDFQQSPSCCQGSWADEKCTHDVIPFYDDLKKLCKMGYVYAKDDLEMDGPQSAIQNCPSKPSYTLEICAGGANTGLLDAPSISAAVAMNPGSGGPLNVPGGEGGNMSGNASATSGGASTSPASPSATGSSASPPGFSFPGISASSSLSGSASSPSPSVVAPTSASSVNPQPDASLSSTSTRSGTHTRHFTRSAGDHYWAGGIQMPEPTPSACNKKRRLSSH